MYLIYYGGFTNSSIYENVLYVTMTRSPCPPPGDNKELVAPDRSTELDGSKSVSPLGTLHYHWEQISGGKGITLQNENSTKLLVNGLTVGSYR